MSLTNEEITIATDLRIKAKRLASRVKSRSSGRMDPQDTPWHEASELADAADTAAWCIGWLVDEVKRLSEYERFYKELNASTAPAAPRSHMEDLEIRQAEDVLFDVHQKVVIPSGGPHAATAKVEVNVDDLYRWLNGLAWARAEANKGGAN